MRQQKNQNMKSEKQIQILKIIPKQMKKLYHINQYNKPKKNHIKSTIFCELKHSRQRKLLLSSPCKDGEQDNKPYEQMHAED